MARKKKTAPAETTAATEETTTRKVDGRQFLRAVSYALKACPDGEGTAHLAHVVFVQNQVVCADGERWHVGIVPGSPGAQQPFVAARSSVKELMIHLRYADAVSRAKSGTWTVELDVWKTDDKLKASVTIEVGGQEPIPVDLVGCEVGYIPETWAHPVAANAAEVAPGEDGMPLRCGHMRDAMSWWRSWDRDHGTCVQRTDASGIRRVEISAGGHLTAVAFLIPATRPAARLPPDEPLFAKQHGRPVGQSILDLQLDADGVTYQKDGDAADAAEDDDEMDFDEDEEDEAGGDPEDQ